MFHTNSLSSQLGLWAMSGQVRRSGGTATAEQVGVFTRGETTGHKTEEASKCGTMAATVHVSAMHS